MVSVTEAEQIILSHLYRPPTETVSIEEAGGRILAETVYADRDLPPFDRVTMDGIALSYEALSKGNHLFPVEGIHRAGDTGRKLINEDSCLEVMTGSVLPEGADVVVRYEDIEIVDGIAEIRSREVQRGQNIHRQGSDHLKGKALLEPPLRLSPAEISVLASVGKSTVRVFARPRIAILSTGDELVAVSEVPASHQIRQSNSYALHSALKQLGIVAVLHHAIDDREVLTKEIARLIEDTDVLLVSGGVSKGKYDHLPAVFDELEVGKHFHGVSQRPGKPFWFGTRGKTTIFAFPGNPVSTFLCFQRYFLPWLAKSSGLHVPRSRAVLARDFGFSPPLTYFLQVSLKNEEGVLMAYPVPGGGSGDFANLRGVDAFLELPPDRELFKAGEVFPCMPFRKP